MSQLEESRLHIADFRGDLLHPGDDGYDEARRVFNGMIDRSPALIARCSTTDDVVAAVNLARTTGLPVSVYGGGHGVTGSAVVDGGICIDLRGMKSIEVDPEAATVRAAGGLTWGELDAATQEFGLAVTGGRMSSTGIAGLALGSGSGWLERKCGLTCDNLIRAELVTADGRVVTASVEENPELFWALRGGGGNFGVVTEFTFALHRVGPVLLAGTLMYPAAMGRELLRFWRDFMLEAPDEVGSGVAFITAPPLDFVPEPVRGQPVIGVVVCYVGDVDDGRKVLAPLLEFGPPAITMVEPIPYVALQQSLDPACPTGMQNYWTGDFLADLPDEAIDTLVGLATKPISPLSQVNVIPGGGAISRVPDDAMAFGERNAKWNMHYLSMWPDPSTNDENIAWTKALSSAMKPWTTGGVYLNYIGDEGGDRVEAGFGREKYARMQRIKADWDPGNLFRHNQNITPAAAPVPDQRTGG